MKFCFSEILPEVVVVVGPDVVVVVGPEFVVVVEPDAVVVEVDVVVVLKFKERYLTLSTVTIVHFLTIEFK